MESLLSNDTKTARYGHYPDGAQLVNAQVCSFTIYIYCLVLSSSDYPMRVGTDFSVIYWVTPLGFLLEAFLPCALRVCVYHSINMKRIVYIRFFRSIKLYIQFVRSVAEYFKMTICFSMSIFQLYFHFHWFKFTVCVCVDTNTWKIVWLWNIDDSSPWRHQPALAHWIVHKHIHRPTASSVSTLCSGCR